LYPLNPAPTCHLDGKTNLTGLDMSIPLELFTEGNDSSRKLPGPMFNYDNWDRQIDSIIPH